MKGYIQEVKVICGNGVNFEIRVNALLAEGWALHGSPGFLVSSEVDINHPLSPNKIVQVLKRWKMVDKPEPTEENPFAFPGNHISVVNWESNDDGTSETQA